MGLPGQQPTAHQVMLYQRRGCCASRVSPAADSVRSVGDRAVRPDASGQGSKALRVGAQEEREAAMQAAGEAAHRADAAAAAAASREQELTAARVAAHSRPACEPSRSHCFLRRLGIVFNDLPEQGGHTSQLETQRRLSPATLANAITLMISDFGNVA